MEERRVEEEINAYSITFQRRYIYRALFEVLSKFERGRVP
jgi:hypothetical protein